MKADVLIAEAGALELSSLVESTPSLANVIWVVKAGNRHMDWNEVPEGIGGKIEVSTWHELVDDGKGAVSPDLPPSEKSSTTKPLITFWPSKGGEVGQLVELTSGVCKVIWCQPISLIHNRISSLPQQLSFPRCPEINE